MNITVHRFKVIIGKGSEVQGSAFRVEQRAAEPQNIAAAGGQNTLLRYSLFHPLNL
jgi:hypothetical protein